VLSVFSPEPRSWTDSETELLRDLALQVQREIDDP
jgi:GAF domain-containing protein